MNSDNDTPGSVTSHVDPERIGFGWGTLFGLLALAFTLPLLLDERYAYLQYLAQTATLLAAPLLLIVAGIWWATHRRIWHLVLGAAVLGLALLACLFAAFAISTWSSGGKLPMPQSVKPFLVVWGILAACALTLAVIVSLHVRRALRRGQGEGRALTSDGTSPLRAPSFAFRVATGLSLPLLLSVPVLLLLRHDIELRNKANTILMQEIDKAQAQIGDIADYEKTRSGLLARKQIIEALEPSSLQTADVLHVFGRMPDGLQLQSVQTKGKGVSFAVHVNSAAGERMLFELLRQSGFRDIDVARDRGESDIEVIAATSTRTDDK
jgi:hypothetical protein